MPYADPEKKKESDRKTSRSPKHRAKVKEWKDNHRHHLRHYNLRRLYDMSEEDYDKLSKEQNGLCAICKNPPPENKFLFVDHDHDTKQVRGLLCITCNTGIGGLRDSPALLEAAAAYLRSKGK